MIKKNKYGMIASRPKDQTKKVEICEQCRHYQPSDDHENDDMHGKPVLGHCNLDDSTRIRTWRACDSAQK